MIETRIAAAPWQLTGRGYAIALYCSRTFARECLRSCPEFEGEALGGMGAMMLIDYESSDVGPYRELLLSPGRFRIGNRRASAITHIWVSSEASTYNGRRNWGLPKRTARFASETHADGSEETVTVRRGDGPPLILTFSAHGPRLPTTTRLFPRSWHTLEQPWHGRIYRTAINARGRTRLARLTHYDNPPGTDFPDFASQTRVLTLAASEFTLDFPAAKVSRIDR